MRALILGIFLAVLACSAAEVQASRNMGQESRACDSFVLQSHSHAAWLGAQRDVEFSEEILLKPDSVLQYSCFINKNPYPILTAGLPRYIQDNFGPRAPAKGEICVQMSKIWHSMKCRNFERKHFMTYKELTTKDPRESYHQCNTPVRSGPGSRFSDSGEYNSNRTRWAESLGSVRDRSDQPQTIMPVNMMINPAYEAHTIEDLQGLMQFTENQQHHWNNLLAPASVLQPDIDEMAPNPNPPIYVQGTFMQPRRWGREITHAYPPPGTPPINGAADAIVTYNKKIMASAGNCSDGPPIPTGVKMIAQGKNFGDAICPVPGCVYNGSACVPR